jgi:hypothetical protein
MLKQMTGKYFRLYELKDYALRVHYGETIQGSKYLTQESTAIAAGDSIDLPAVRLT